MRCSQQCWAAYPYYRSCGVLKKSISAWLVKSGSSSARRLVPPVHGSRRPRKAARVLASQGGPGAQRALPRTPVHTWAAGGYEGTRPAKPRQVASRSRVATDTFRISKRGLTSTTTLTVKEVIQRFYIPASTGAEKGNILNHGYRRHPPRSRSRHRLNPEGDSRSAGPDACLGCRTMRPGTSRVRFSLSNAPTILVSAELELIRTPSCPTDGQLTASSNASTSASRPRSRRSRS